MENLRRKNSDWVRGSCIGRGCFGTVHSAINKSDGRIFAIKSVDLSSCLPAQSEALENEIRIIRSISSPYVVEYLSDDFTTEDRASFRNLHMEYMPGGTAADVAKDEEILRSRIYCMVAGLRNVHNSGIVHCDVKGRNVLIGSSPSVAKLADFGSARFATQSIVGQIVPRGSPLWMAPEVIRGKYQGPESDVWSMGCTVIEMVTGQPPWEDSGPDTLLRIGYSEEIPELPTQLSELGKDFLDKCLRRDRTKRWSCDQLLRHPFVSSSQPLNAITHVSPRSVLDWANSDFSDDEEENDQFSPDSELVYESARGRIGELASNSGAIWESGGWVKFRDVMNDKTEAGSGPELEIQFSNSINTDRVNMEVSNSSDEVAVSNSLNIGWVNMKVINSGDDVAVAVAENGGDGDVRPTDFSWMHGYEGFTAGKNILFYLLILTAIICTSILLTVIKRLQLFKFYLRFQSVKYLALLLFYTQIKYI